MKILHEVNPVLRQILDEALEDTRNILDLLDTCYPNLGRALSKLFLPEGIVGIHLPQHERGIIVEKIVRGVTEVDKLRVKPILEALLNNARYLGIGMLVYERRYGRENVRTVTLWTSEPALFTIFAQYPIKIVLDLAGTVKAFYTDELYVSSEVTRGLPYPYTEKAIHIKARTDITQELTFLLNFSGNIVFPYVGEDIRSLNWVTIEKYYTYFLEKRNTSLTALKACMAETGKLLREKLCDINSFLRNYFGTRLNVERSAHAVQAIINNIVELIQELR